jgi:AcrR family transcriptional regulator
MEQSVRRKDIPPQRRKQIFDAAAELFSRGGYHGVTVDAIAQRAGISKGNLYWYFRSKQEIFQLLVDDLVLKLYLPVAEVLESDLPPYEKLRDAARSCMASAEADPHAVHLLWQIVTQPELHHLLSSEFQHWINPFVEHIASLFAEMGEEDPEGVALLYAFTLDALTFIVMIGHDVYDRQRLLAALEKKFLNPRGGENGQR